MELHWKLGEPIFGKAYWYAYHDGKIVSTEQGNISPDGKVSDEGLIFVVTGDTFFNPLQKQLFASKMSELFPDIPSDKISESINLKIDTSESEITSTEEPSGPKSWSANIYFKDTPDEIMQGYIFKENSDEEDDDEGIFYYVENEEELKGMMAPDNSSDWVVTSYEPAVYENGGDLVTTEATQDDLKREDENITLRKVDAIKAYTQANIPALYDHICELTLAFENDMPKLEAYVSKALDEYNVPHDNFVITLKHKFGGVLGISGDLSTEHIPHSDLAHVEAKRRADQINTSGTDQAIIEDSGLGFNVMKYAKVVSSHPELLLLATGGYLPKVHTEDDFKENVGGQAIWKNKMLEIGKVNGQLGLYWRYENPSYQPTFMVPDWSEVKTVHEDSMERYKDYLDEGGIRGTKRKKALKRANEGVFDYMLYEKGGNLPKMEEGGTIDISVTWQSIMPTMLEAYAQTGKKQVFDEILKCAQVADTIVEASGGYDNVGRKQKVIRDGKEVEVIDMTPTWVGIFRIPLEVYTQQYSSNAKGSSEKRKEAFDYLMDMARVADMPMPTKKVKGGNLDENADGIRNGDKFIVSVNYESPTGAPGTKHIPVIIDDIKNYPTRDSIIDAAHAKFLEKHKDHKIVGGDVEQINHRPNDKMDKGGQMRALCDHGTEIQTLIFSKDKFNRAQAIEWTTDHDFHMEYVDSKENTYRIRQQNPNRFDKESLRTIELKDGVQAVVGCPVEKKSLGGILLGTAIGAGLVYVAKKSDKVEPSEHFDLSTRDGRIKKGKAVDKRISSMKPMDLPQKISFYDDHRAWKEGSKSSEFRHFYKFNSETGKWIEIDRVEYDSYLFYTFENKEYEYERGNPSTGKKYNEGTKRVRKLVKGKLPWKQSGGDLGESDLFNPLNRDKLPDNAIALLSEYNERWWESFDPHSLGQEMQKRFHEIGYEFDLDLDGEGINLRKVENAEHYRTLSFKTKRQAEKNQKEIENHFGDRLINSEILFGKDERGNEGHYVKYSLHKTAVPEQKAQGGDLATAKKKGRGRPANVDPEIILTKDEVVTMPSDSRRVYHTIEGKYGEYEFYAKTDNSHTVGHGSDGINKGYVYKLKILKPDGTGGWDTIADYWNKWDYRSKGKKDGKVRSKIIGFLELIADRTVSSV